MSPAPRARPARAPEITTHAQADAEIARYVAGRTWFHGTKRQRLGELAAAAGELAPSSDTGVTTAKGAARPMRGRVYLSDRKDFALDYAIGSWLGHAGRRERAEWVDRLRRDVRSGGSDRYGYVFEVAGTSLNGLGPRAIEPDEDAAGYAAYRAAQRLEVDDEEQIELDPDWMDYRWPGILRSIESSQALASAVNEAAAAMTLDEQARTEIGDFKAWFSGGKRMVRSMDPALRAALIKVGASISVRGRLRISAAWRLDKFLVADVSRDASNLFSVCERVRQR